MEHVKHAKEEAMNHALNSFQLNGGSIIKSGQQSQNGPRKTEPGKSLNKSGQISVKNQNTILSSVGL